MRRKATVVVLVGPKGAGKSTIGDLIASELGLHFIRVEPLFIELRDQIGASHPEFETRGFDAVFTCMSQALSTHPVVCFESTGASTMFGELLTRLSRVARVVPVRVYASPNQYLDRVRSRDLSVHIAVSDDRVEQINAAAQRVTLPWAAEINNSGRFEPVAIINIFRRLLSSEEPEPPEGFLPGGG